MEPNVQFALTPLQQESQMELARDCSNALSNESAAMKNMFMFATFQQ
jgi:hypothetical protein